ncbi:MAG: bifunctional hydroxymethylpyrimidine kinase/phosphomethylpyrimidine kinase [Candidatus Pacebacteria bacterium]|nr:bifunctional hydroxymethylpyrimidine kinase/phosphomethylpyrimidine kinase [Candidatus Paceibacterota bacterium]
MQRSLKQPHTEQAAATPGQPVALSIAGSDSGGGAGIQADLRAFAFFNVFGTTAITAITAQNPNGVRDVHGVPSETVTAQIAAVTEAFTIGAAKTGMLFDTSIVQAVANATKMLGGCPLVMDPVMVATSGAVLLRDTAVRALCAELLPRATVITPNIAEAEIILGRTLEDLADLDKAALELAQRFGVAALVKGGHRQTEEVIDVMSDGRQCWQLSTPRADAASTHGTGCSLSAALAACLARGDKVVEAVAKAKAYVYSSLKNCVRVGEKTWAMGIPSNLERDAVSIREITE